MKAWTRPVHRRTRIAHPPAGGRGDGQRAPGLVAAFLLVGKSFDAGYADARSAAIWRLTRWRVRFGYRQLQPRRAIRWGFGSTPRCDWPLPDVVLRLAQP